MITYETLMKIEQQEKNSLKLSRLPHQFLREVMDYLQKKESISREKGEEWQYEAARQRFRSIMELRERKILNFTLSFVRSGAVPEDMLPEETQLFDSLVKNIQDFHAKRDKAMSGEKFSMLAVAFLQDVPQFVGIDMGYYGPYMQGDIATVPEENAKLIAEKGGGEVVEPG